PDREKIRRVRGLAYVDSECMVNPRKAYSFAEGAFSGHKLIMLSEICFVDTEFNLPDLIQFYLNCLRQ
ncbi:MAG: hypothetical protein KJ573_07270, partial [Proteobacteria bacterium]|nr:hypothetical protein [Pseudomonadota bacterium]